MQMGLIKMSAFVLYKIPNSFVCSVVGGALQEETLFLASFFAQKLFVLNECNSE